MRTTADRRGMSMVELVVCLLIALALVEMAVPLAENGVQRARELEARASLRDVRRAVDRWHDDARARSVAGGLAWPPSLDALVEAKLLRAVPLDPLTGHADWLVVPSGDGANVFDVRTRAKGRTLDGVDYADL
jgi:general secretion pathway protein G